MASGGITLGAGVFKMTLHRPSASANILRTSNGGISTFASVGFEVSGGGYTPSGKNLGPASGKWTVGASTKAMKFATNMITFTANATVFNIKYALIRTSMTPTNGKVVCFCTLSANGFNLTASALNLFPIDGVFQLS